jgi:TonB family protein
MAQDSKKSSRKEARTLEVHTDRLRADPSVYTQAEQQAEVRYRRRAWVLTLALFTVVTVAFMFLGFRTPLPLPEEEGIDVVLGTVDYGEQQQATRNQPVPEEPVEETVEPDASQASPSEPVEATEEVVTGNEAEAPEVKTEQKSSTETEESKQQREESQSEPEKEKEEEQKPPKVDPNALYAPQNKSKGEEGKAGDKGARDGSEESSSFERRGESNVGDGISFNLDGRSLRKPPRIEDQSQKSGKVVVEIIVNKEGRVISAKPGARGSTTLDKVLLKKAREAAYQTRFSPSNAAPDQQVGTMTFEFKLQ